MQLRRPIIFLNVQFQSLITELFIDIIIANIFVASTNNAIKEKENVYNKNVWHYFTFVG